MCDLYFSHRKQRGSKLCDCSLAPCSPCCNLLHSSRHLSNSKATHVRALEVFSSNYSCDQYTHIDNITLKVFFPNPNTHQRSKAHFLVITHGGSAPMQFTRWTSVNNGREQLAVHCSAVGRRTAAVTRCLHRAPPRLKPHGKGKDINSV